MLNFNLSLVNSYKKLNNQFKISNKAVTQPIIKNQTTLNNPNVAFKGIYICPPNIKKMAAVSQKYSFQKLESFFDGINMDRSKAILKVLVSSCKKENILGEGKLHVTFSIPGTDDFIIRVLKTEDIKMGILKKEAIPFINQNIGQVVGSLVGSGADVQFMRKVKGYSAGTPYNLFKAAKKLNPETVEKLVGQDKYVENILNISQVPQSTFNNLATKIKMLRNQGYVYDIANPNNIMLQKGEKGGLPSFTIIDDLYKIDDIKRSYNGQAWAGTLEDMVYPLMDLKAGTLYCKESKDLANNTKLLNDVKTANAEVFKKCVTASKKAGLPLNKEKFDPSHLSEMTGIEESTITKIFDNWNNYLSN